MKGITGATIMMIIIVLFIILSARYTKHTCKNISKQVESIEDLVRLRDFESASTEIENLESGWYEKKNILSLIMHHHELQDISGALEEAKIYIHQQDQTESLIQLNNLYTKIEELPNMYNWEYYNIM